MGSGWENSTIQLGLKGLNISWNPVTLTKKWEINTAHDDKKTLKIEKILLSRKARYL